MFRGVGTGVAAGEGNVVISALEDLYWCGVVHVE